MVAALSFHGLCWRARFRNGSACPCVRSKEEAMAAGRRRGTFARKDRRSRRKSIFTASKKNPAEAGFSTHYRVDHSAGTMFEAWAPFGPWVTS